MCSSSLAIGRERHPPLDHRDRLDRGHRRAAAQHVLQHRHRDLHLGAHQKTPLRKGKVQLIDATQWFKPLCKNLGKKTCDLSDEGIGRLCATFLAFDETEQSKIFPNAAIGRCGSRASTQPRLCRQGDQGTQGDRRARGRRAAGHPEDSQEGHRTGPPARVVRRHHRRQARRRRV